MPRKNIVIGNAKFRPVPKAPHTWECGDILLEDRFPAPESWGARVVLGTFCGVLRDAWGQGASPEEAVSDLRCILLFRQQEAATRIAQWGEVQERAAAALALIAPKEDPHE